MAAVILDLETTGRYPYWDEITEMAAVAMRFDQDAQEWQPASDNHEFVSLVKTKRRIPAEVTKLTGISNKDVEMADEFTVVWKRFGEWVREQRAEDESFLLIGHNLFMFDLPILARQLGQDQAQQVLDELGITKAFDTLKWARKNLSLKSNKLGHVYEHITGQKLDDAHRALVDARAVSSIMQTRPRDFCNWTAAHGVESVSTLIDDFFQRKQAYEEKKESKKAKSATSTTSPKKPEHKEVKQKDNDMAVDDHEVEMIAAFFLPKKYRRVDDIVGSGNEQMCQQCRHVYSSFFGHVCV